MESASAFIVLLLGRVQVLVGHPWLPSWLLMWGFNCEMTVLFNCMGLIYWSLVSKGYSGSVSAAWTWVGSLLYVDQLEQECWTRMTSRGAFQTQLFCDSEILYRTASASCASIAFSWAGFFILDAPAVLSATSERIPNFFPSKLRIRVYNCQE